MLTIDLLVELYLTSDGDVQRSTKYRNFTGCCHRTHTERNAANSTAVATAAILLIVADVIITYLLTYSMEQSSS